MLRDDDDVTYLYLPAGVSHHDAAAGRAVENRRSLVVRTGTFPIDDGAAGDQGSATGYHNVTLGCIVVEDSVRTCRAGPLFAASRRGGGRCSRRGISAGRV